jgi:hypothetical protein
MPGNQQTARIHTGLAQPKLQTQTCKTGDKGEYENWCSVKSPFHTKLLNQK